MSTISRPNKRGVNGFSQDFLNGINEFISFAERNCKEADGRIRCPCCTCCNSTLKSLDEVRFDIVSNGFLPNYTYWDSHSEGDEDLYYSGKSIAHEDEHGSDHDDDDGVNHLLVEVEAGIEMGFGLGVLDIPA
ncbi:hypothetical protein POM88_014296 [Heracleum sosnowskyi]|uniref:Transposase-associated domain-containing protein n=1 Tax=Heracleum sosnowskyi TaxID=360622 RepID=A0AAD8J046_9APIA|nr:hypothetical protein POM88_014296 [Heracleum sosnowskyi]